MSNLLTAEDGRIFELSESALKHIVSGDITERVERESGVSSVVNVLKGGLHTYEGWVHFKSQHKELTHLHYFNSTIHKHWYYARELQNGVITLRVPKYLFKDKAAKMTMYPDEYYKSGYLWKTLFPESYGKEKIIDAIEEALKNLDKSASKKGQLVGYADFSDPLKTLRITIQYRNNKIHSAFPSWTQPNTGNNGKAYSHFDSIGHIIAESTEYFKDVPIQEEQLDSISICCRKELDLLEQYTPSIFLNRTIPKGSRLKWEEKRNIELKSESNNTSEAEAQSIQDYLTSFELCKNGYLISLAAYQTLAEISKANKIFFNTYQINQNIIDGLKLLALFDNKHKTDHFKISMKYLILNMVCFGQVDSLLKRKIYCCISRLCMSYHDGGIIGEFISLLSTSPTRREWLTEFSADTLAKKKISLPSDEFPWALQFVKDPSLDIPIDYEDLVEFIKESLGDTYSWHFDDKFRENLVARIMGRGGRNFKHALQDFLLYMNVDDLHDFSFSFKEIIEYIIKLNSDIDISDPIRSILRDYCRLQFAHRFRVNLLYKEYEDVDIFPTFPIEDEFVKRTILKHERWMNTQRLDVFISSIQTFSSYSKDVKLQNESEALKLLVGKEVPPMPEPIPQYIRVKYAGNEIIESKAHTRDIISEIVAENK